MYGNTKVLYMPDVQMRTGRKCPQAYVGGFVETLDVELLLEDAAVMEDILKIKAFYEDEATSKSMWRDVAWRLMRTSSQHLSYCARPFSRI